MNITVANSAGFCFGVKRAVDVVYKEAAKQGYVYTFGPIIHNESVVEELGKMGVKVINSPKELKDCPKGTIIIRSHGISEDTLDEIASYGHNIIDATCPYVKKIHKIVREQSSMGKHIIIVGNRSHPEVAGIVGWCENNDDYTVIENETDAESFQFTFDRKLSIVSQTTYNYKKFQDIVEIITKKGYDIFVLNTICNATQERQSEAYQLASNSDAMIVIGGEQSSNTKKLYEICKNECENTYYIQKLDDLDLNLFKSYRNVGITAG
ncbi:MAG: hypothetical protein K0S76_2350, partial [Herbinix sp.]|nr:hypothetical protein [Herbinix sp.]